MPLQLTPLPAERFDGWREGFHARLIARSERSRLRVGADAVDHADRFIAELLPQGADTPTARLLSIADGTHELGTIWLGMNGGRLFLIDLDAESPLPNDELFGEIVRIAREHDVTRISASLFPQDAAGHALLAGRGFTLASIQMLLEPVPRRPYDDDVLVEPMTVERFPSYAAASESAFAEDLVASGRYTREQAVAESRRQMLLEVPEGIDSPGQSFFTASVGGVEVGILWVGARQRDGRPHAFVLDIEVAADQRRKGYGLALMHAAERAASALGAESIGLHVFGFNTGAMALYERLGYRRVEESYLLDL